MNSKLPKVKPMLAIPAEPFDSNDYLYEIKWDGYRGLVYLNEKTTILSRNLIDLTDRFPELQDLHKSVIQKPAILDGEIVVLEGGKPSFSKLQSRGKITDTLKVNQLSRRFPANFIAFDVLYKNGESIMDLPLRSRKKVLEEIVEQGTYLIVSQYVHGSGIKFNEAVQKVGLEGMMAKRLDSLYIPGKRSPAWKKIRNIRSAEWVIAGWERGEGHRHLGSLVLVGFSQGKWVYMGKVGTGFGKDEEAKLLSLMEPLKIDESVFTPPKGELRTPIWVNPTLICEVTFTEISQEGRLRHPSYKGLRYDKSPQECTIDQ